MAEEWDDERFGLTMSMSNQTQLSKVGGGCIRRGREVGVSCLSCVIAVTEMHGSNKQPVPASQFPGHSGGFAFYLLRLQVPSTRGGVQLSSVENETEKGYEPRR